MIKRILIISSEFPPFPGGIGNHAFNLAKSLKEEEWDVKVLTEFRGIDMKEERFFDLSLPFIVIRTKRVKILLITYLQRILKLFTLLNSSEQYVIASGKFSLWMVALGKLLFPKHHYLAVVHGSEVNVSGWAARKLTHWSLKKLNQLIAVSSFTKQLLLNVDSSFDITIINNGFAPKKVEKVTNEKLKGYPVLITVGNVTHRKGQHNVILALPTLISKYPNIQYHVVGIPTEKEQFTTLAKQLGVGDHVIFHGVVSDNYLVNLLNGADIFIMLSDPLQNGDVEGFGIAILEANYIGLPVVGSNNSGIVDAVKENYSGKLVNSKQPEAILEAINTILETYSTYSSNARKWSNDFTWDKVINQYKQVFSELSQIDSF